MRSSSSPLPLFAIASSFPQDCVCVLMCQRKGEQKMSNSTKMVSKCPNPPVVNHMFLSDWLLEFIKTVIVRSGGKTCCLNTHYWGTCPLTALGTGLSLRFVSDWDRRTTVFPAARALCLMKSMDWPCTCNCNQTYDNACK